MITDLHPEEFRKLLYRTADIICDLYTDIGAKPVYHSKGYREIRALFDEDLPQEPSAIASMLEKIASEVIPNVALHYSPHFYAWVTSNASQASILGELLAAALNVNATTWMNAASASEMELQVIKWVGRFIHYHAEAGGVLLSGGSMANLSGLRVCIAQRVRYDFNRRGMDRQRPLIFYVSAQNHFCIDRAIEALGIGRQNLRKIRTTGNFTIDTAALREQIGSDLQDGCVPLCVIGNAGTVNTGAVDPIDELAEICREFALWLHLDAAYGGFAASGDLRNSLFKGLDLADSLAIDLHKWLFVPFECGCLLVKKAQQLKECFSMIPEYQQFDTGDLRVDFSEYSLQQSRHFRALKAWMNFKTYGAENLRNSIRNSMDVMQYLGQLVEEADDFELVTPVSLSVVCFRYTGTSAGWSEELLNRLNKQIIEATEAGGRVFIRGTTLNGTTVLRACCTNFRREKEHVEHLLKELRAVGERLAVSLR